MKKNYISICRNYEFQKLYKKGKSCVSPLLVTYYLHTNRPVNRVGITSTKKVGCAVKRNKARRLIRAAYQELEPLLPESSLDFVFVCRSKTPDVSMNEIKKHMGDHFVRLGLIRSEDVM